MCDVGSAIFEENFRVVAEESNNNLAIENASGVDIEELSKLIALSELIKAAQSFLQEEGIAGGHRGSVDSSLTNARNELYRESEELRKKLKLK